ncbi:Protein SLG1 [Savitreella phatthalungensis]
MLRRLLLLGAASSAAAQAVIGCYKTDSSFTDLGSYLYQSKGYCLEQCKAAGYSIAATSQGDHCLCSNSQPSGSAVSSSSCNLACSGYPSDNCGGDSYMYVFSTGGSATSAAQTSTTGTAKNGATTSTATPTAAAQTIIVTSQQQGTTIIKTVVASATATTSASRSSSTQQSSNSSKSSSGGGIGAGGIAGVIIGVIAALAIIAGLVYVFWWRRRHDDDDDDATGRVERGSGNPQMRSAFGAGSTFRTNPKSAANQDNAPLPAVPAFDQRLDHGMVGRRNSQESLADNFDYSRRILRVVNS